MLTHSMVTGFRPPVLLPAIFGGSWGVEIFFWISGFVLFLPYARAMLGEREMPSLRHFVWRRAIKILPSYWLCLGVTGFLFVIPPDIERNRTQEMVRHALLIHPFFHESMFSILSAFWSLGIEAQFYVLFPLIAWAMCRRPILTYLGALAIGEGFRLWNDQTGNAGDFWWVCQFPAQIDLFVLGMLTAWLYVRLRRHARPNIVREAASSALAVAALAAFAFYLKEFADVTIGGNYQAHQAYQNDHRLIVGYLVAAFGIGSLFGHRWWIRAVANPVLLWISGISYNLYLWHEAIMNQCDESGFPCMGVGRGWLWDPNYSTHFFFGYFFVSIGVAWLITRAVEAPLLRWQPTSFSLPVDHVRQLLRALRGRFGKRALPERSEPATPVKPGPVR